MPEKHDHFRTLLVGSHLIRDARETTAAIHRELTDFAAGVEGARYDEDDAPANELAEIKAETGMLADELARVLEVFASVDRLEEKILQWWDED